MAAAIVCPTSVDSVAEVEATARRLGEAGVGATEAAPYPQYAPDYWATFFSDPDGIRLEVTNYRAERRRRYDEWFRADPHPRAPAAAAAASRRAPINLAEKLARFDDHWAPKVVSEINDYQLKLVKMTGDFVWHSHPDTDELFLVVEGNLRIDFRDGAITLGPGEMFVVLRGIEHKPCAESEASVLVIEPRGVVNTGDAGGARTAPRDVWV